MTKLPSGILVRDSSTNAIYFIDNGKKRHITNEEALAGGAFIDIDSSHLLDLPDGKPIDTKPNFDWKSQDEINQMLGGTGINWQKPKGYDPNASGTTNNNNTTTTNNNTNGTTNEQEDILANLPKEVSDRIYKAFGRLPTKQDAENYNHNPDLFNQQIDDAIAQVEADKVAEEETATTAEQQANLDEALGIIDQAVKDGTLPPDLAEMYKTVIKNYPPGVEFEAEQIIEEFNKIKNETIDPYFAELAAVAISDIENSFNVAQESRGLELEAEERTAEERIKGTKADLERRGMTFAGEGIEDLGAGSAFTENGNVPFGGVLPEGTINQANRLMASSSSARYGETIQGIGRAGEDLLGTEAMSGIGIPYTPGGVNLTGQLRNQQQGQYGSTLQQIINRYRQQQQGLQDIQF